MKKEEKLEKFFREIEKICLRYNISIVPLDEDGGIGEFTLEEYAQWNMNLLKSADSSGILDD